MHLHVYMYAYILYRLEIGAILYSWVIFAMCFAVAAVVTDACSSARLRCIGVYAVCLLSIDVQCELQHLIFVVTPLTNACTPLSPSYYNYHLHFAFCIIAIGNAMRK